MQTYPQGNVSQTMDGMCYRVVQDECPEAFQAFSEMPNLEDVYLYWLKK